MVLTNCFIELRQGVFTVRYEVNSSVLHILTIIIMLLLPEGQTCKAWEP